MLVAQTDNVIDICWCTASVQATAKLIAAHNSDLRVDGKLDRGRLARVVQVDRVLIEQTKKWVRTV